MAWGGTLEGLTDDAVAVSTPRATKTLTKSLRLMGRSNRQREALRASASALPTIDAGSTIILVAAGARLNARAGCTLVTTRAGLRARRSTKASDKGGGHGYAHHHLAASANCDRGESELSIQGIQRAES